MNPAIKEWKAQEAKISVDLKKRMEEMSPEPLFQTYYMSGRPKICLACCNEMAQCSLWSSPAGRSIVPMCKRCAADWNVIGYYILKRISPFKMFWRLFKFKMKNMFNQPYTFDIVSDVVALLKWSRKMSLIMKRMKGVA